jgi:hypothetical protein
LSHESTPHRVPACHHFLRGNCSNLQCRYAHVRVNPAAPVCRAFALLGYCPKGAECTARHVHMCPDFDQNGECSNKKCKLPHIERAGRRRAAAAAERAKTELTMAVGFASSEDEDEDEDDIASLNSDDVDSDILSDVDIVRSNSNDNDSLMEDFIKF